MASGEDGAPKPVQIRRDWLKLRLHKDKYKGLASKISKWGDKPNSKIFPVSKVFRAQQKAFKTLSMEIREEEGHELSELVGMLRDFSMPQTLPLSGQDIVLKDVDRDSRQWSIKAKPFGDNPSKDFPEIRDFFL